MMITLGKRLSFSANQNLDLMKRLSFIDVHQDSAVGKAEGFADVHQDSAVGNQLSQYPTPSMA
jgi:hypothetical protein